MGKEWQGVAFYSRVVVGGGGIDVLWTLPWPGRG